MKDVGFEEMGEYVVKSHNIATQYIAAWPIMDLCKGTVQIPGAWVANRW